MWETARRQNYVWCRMSASVCVNDMSWDECPINWLRIFETWAHTHVTSRHSHTQENRTFGHRFAPKNHTHSHEWPRFSWPVTLTHVGRKEKAGMHVTERESRGQKASFFGKVFSEMKSQQQSKNREWKERWVRRKLCRENICEEDLTRLQICIFKAHKKATTPSSICSIMSSTHEKARDFFSPLLIFPFRRTRFPAEPAKIKYLKKIIMMREKCLPASLVRSPPMNAARVDKKELRLLEKSFKKYEILKLPINRLFWDEVTLGKF